MKKTGTLACFIFLYILYRPEFKTKSFQTNLSTVLVSRETPLVHKTCHCNSCILFVPKTAKISDQSDKRKFHASLLLSALTRILRRFRFFRLQAT